ncbi:hypothetical protein [Labedaea rhizosphaerae]|uniref:Uncharacterized protein n=1 Tax=Labedaea rhizosphaerae TaxID=598644 RepID=A0A4R6RQW3_LABRH|nr:hypothetical protein [Labedaea rhizosphaerae]TDP89193.1 hypothetical protein EV186_11417 [Labedaea rhizosphaerae]
MTDDNLDELKDEIESVEKGVRRRVELGTRAMVIAVSVMVVLIGLTLPWMRGVTGWEVLLGTVTGKATMVPRLFSGTSLLFGVLASMGALVTQRWGMVWIGALGGWFAAVDGVLAIWSRQSSTDGLGLGVGLPVAEIAVVVIAVCWFRTAWSRAPGGKQPTHLVPRLNRDN